MSSSFDLAVEISDEEFLENSITPGEVLIAMMLESIELAPKQGHIFGIVVAGRVIIFDNDLLESEFEEIARNVILDINQTKVP